MKEYLGMSKAQAWGCPLSKIPKQLVALQCVFNPVNCPAVICLPCIAVLLSFGRETSLVNIMGPRSILPPLFTVAPWLRGPERPVIQPRDQVFWNTALLDIELNNFLLPQIRVHGVYYNA